jgi:hypothetical protein
MFNIDPTTILLLLVLCPLIALVCALNLSGYYDHLPYHPWLMRLPGYRFLYDKRADSDIPDRSIKTTLIWLGVLYLSVLVYLAPFANKLLGMLAWFAAVPACQEVLVLFFDLCVVGACYGAVAMVKDLRAQSDWPYRFLALVGLSLLLGAAATVAMSATVQTVVLFSCKTTLIGLLGFVFFGALWLASNETESKTGTGEIGSRFVSFILMLLSVGSLVSIVV